MIPDVFIHALRDPKDYVGIVRTHDIVLTDMRELGDEIYEFRFTKPKKMHWKPGQHALFTFPGHKFKERSWRAFSIASSYHEDEIIVSTIIPEPHLEFKEVMKNMKIGDTIRMHGPYGEFYPSGKTQHIIGIAGGIGVTAFRAMAYDIAHGFLPDTKLTLMFSAREVFAFKEEFDSWQSDRLTMIYNHTPEEVNEELKTLDEQYGNTADYYISGSPRMIEALSNKCELMGVKTIMYDPFKGY